MKTFTKRAVLAVVLTAPFVILLYYVEMQPHLDFYYFYYAFHVVWDRLPAQELYNISSQHRWFASHGFHVYQYNQYVYPPQFAVLFSWLGSTSLVTAEYLWTAMSWTSYLIALLMILPVAQPVKRLIPQLLFYLLAIVNAPFWWDLTIGNANWLIFFMLILGIYLHYHRRHPWWAGIPFGLAIIFKVSPGILLVYFLVRKQWKVMTSTLLTIVTTSLISILVLGLKPFTYYLTHLSKMTTTSMKNGFAPYNSSIIGVLGYWNQQHVISLPTTSLHPIFIVYAGFITILLGTALYWQRRALSRDIRVDVSIGLISILLYSPLVEGTHLIVAYIAAWLLFGVWWDRTFSKAGGKRKAGSNASAGAMLLLVWVLLSPVGWALRHIVPIEFFCVLILLLCVTLALSLQQYREFKKDSQIPLSVANNPQDMGQ